MIGQIIGRWGNFMNAEAYGYETTLPWRMGIERISGGGAFISPIIEVHPTFLYESLWNAVGFVALHFFSKKRQYDGQIALGYVAWYGLGRAIVEGLRTDSLWWGPFRVSQLLAAISCVAAVTVLLVQAFRVHDRESLFANKVAAKAAAEAEAAEAKEAEVVEEEPAEETPAEEPTEE